MGIQIISISHKIAPLHVREMFAFTQEQQKHLMEEMVTHPEIAECIVLSTCNRTEMYVYSDSESKGLVFGLMEEVLLKEAGAQEEEEIGNYLLFYHGGKAIHHLFLVAAGLDSMVIGEDQILGQVKTAHKPGTGNRDNRSLFKYLFPHGRDQCQKSKDGNRSFQNIGLYCHTDSKDGGRRAGYIKREKDSDHRGVRANWRDCPDESSVTASGRYLCDNKKKYVNFYQTWEYRLFYHWIWGQI